MPRPPEQPADSAALSLLEMRRHLLRRAGALGARAKEFRRQGAQQTAAQLASQSDRLLTLARRMAKQQRR